MPISIRTLLAGAAISLSIHALPANAQNATFSEVRDSVPAKYFDPASTAAQLGDANTLVIGFHGDPFRASAEVGGATGTRLATDTLTVVVAAPAGYYVSSITCHVSGRGAVNTPGDARASANCVINGKPEDLGSVGGSGRFPNTGGDWSLSSATTALTDPTLTTVPVSLTAQLFAFAAPALASAEVDLTSASIVVTVSPSTASPRE